MPNVREVLGCIQTEAINSEKELGKSFQMRYHEGRMRLCQRREEWHVSQRKWYIQSSAYLHNVGSFRETYETGSRMEWGIKISVCLQERR